MPKPYVEPKQHNLVKTKPKPNQLIVLSIYNQGRADTSPMKYIGRYQPESNSRIYGPMYEKLNSVFMGGVIYEFPTRGSLSKKIEPSRNRLHTSLLLDDTFFRYKWNYFSEETDTIYKKEFEQVKNKEIKKIASQIVKDIKNGNGPDEIDPEVQLVINMMARCGKGTRRNKVTGNCDPVTQRSPVSTSAKLARCPNGTRRNKVTKKCE